MERGEPLVREPFAALNVSVPVPIGPAEYGKPPLAAASAESKRVDLPRVRAGLRHIDIDRVRAAQIVVRDERRFARCIAPPPTPNRSRAESAAATTVAPEGTFTASTPDVVGVAASPDVMTLTFVRPASEFDVPQVWPAWTLLPIEIVAGRIDEVAVRVGHEGAVPGEIEGAARIGHDEVAVALNGEVRRGRGADDRALQRIERAQARRDAARGCRRRRRPDRPASRTPFRCSCSRWCWRWRRFAKWSKASSCPPACRKRRCPSCSSIGLLGNSSVPVNDRSLARS